MNCAEARQMMGRVLAGDDVSLAEHFAGCGGCRDEWTSLAALSTRVAVSAPAAVETSSPLIELGDTTPVRTPVRLAKWSIALVAAAAIALALWPRPEQFLLAQVQAAAAQHPTYLVCQGYRSEGVPVSRQEAWTMPSGDRHSVVVDPRTGARHTSLHHAGQNAFWSHHENEATGKDEYSLGWTTPTVTMNQGPPPGSQVAALDDTGRIGLSSFLGGVSMEYARDMRVSERQATLDGERCRLVEIRGEMLLSLGPLPIDPEWSPIEIRGYLSADGERLLKLVELAYHPDGALFSRYESYPIMHDAGACPPPPEFRVPRDANAKFDGKPIDPIWEYWADSEKQRLRTAFEGMAAGWASGDGEQFVRHCDFAAGLKYGVKGKFTAEQIRDRTKRSVESIHERWTERQVMMDYAFRTPNPPPLAVSRWGMYRENPQSDGGWIKYGDEPSREPGILILGRERVVDRSGEVQELRTKLFFKEIDGEYKLILWRPKFE
ncbi:MAG: hypothetical protein QGI33_04760 [Candidatus Brocadiia bacterium]|nr:hypothetical protein [Candidatus Brocadiia bacterium]